MLSINSKKLIAFIVLCSFLWAIGCATTESYKSPVREKTDPYIIELEEISSEPYNTIVIKKGEIAPTDGVLYTKEDAKRALETETAYRGLRSEIEIQNKMSRGRAAQIDVLYETIDLQKEANVELIREIERNKKWAKWEKWGTGILTILGIIASKYVWD